MSSLVSVSTSSTGGSTVEVPTFKGKVSSWFGRNKASKKSGGATNVEYQPLSKSDTMPPSGKQPIPVAPPMIPNDRSSHNKVLIGEYLEEEEKKQQRPSTFRGHSPDSGFDSPDPSSSYIPIGITPKSLTQALAGLKKTGSPYKSERPSTHVFGQKPTQVNLKGLETLV